MSINIKMLPEVTSNKLYTDNQYKNIDDDGLLSQRIFGPIKSYNCACGKFHNKLIHNGDRCPVCRTLCTNSNVRYKTFAKIKIPYPIITNIKEKKILKITDRKTRFLFFPNQYDIHKDTNLFLHFDVERNKIYIKSGFSKTNSIPIELTGILSIYVSLRILNELVADMTYVTELLECFTYNILVVPPNCRHPTILTQNDKNKLIKNELNENYLKLLQLNGFEKKQDENFLSKKIEQCVCDVKSIMASPKTNVYFDIELHDYEFNARQYQIYVNMLSDNIKALLNGKYGMVRSSFISKRLDFSSRAILSINPLLNTYEVFIPKKIFIKLYFLEYLKYIKSINKFDFEKIQLIVKNSDNINYNPQYIDAFIEYFFTNPEINENSKLIFINRQPTLWRWGIPVFRIKGLSTGDTIEISQLACTPMAADYDGDTVGCYRIHDSNALAEMKEKAYSANFIKFDHNNEYLHELFEELLYGLNILKHCNINHNKNPIMLNDGLQSLPESYEMLNNLDTPVNIYKHVYKYGICLLNKWCLNDKIIITSTSDTNEINKCIQHNTNSNIEYHDVLSTLCRKIYWLSTINTKECVTLPFDESCNILEKQNYNLINKLPTNAYIGINIFYALLKLSITDIPKNYKMFKLTKSRFNERQYARSIFNIGYIANGQGEVIHKPILNNLFFGLTENDFYKTSFGSRNGFVSKTKSVPESGYMERVETINLSVIELDTIDCNTSHGFPIEIKTKKYANNLVGRYYIDGDKTKLFTENDIDSSIKKTIYFRSPITCNNKNFSICKKCFGEYDIKTKYIGLMAGQVISERLTQLSMSSFHHSGSATLPLNANVIKIIQESLIDIKENVDDYDLIFNKNITKYKKDFQEIKSFIKISKNIVKYEKIKENTLNEDITKNIRILKKCLLTETKDIKSINDTYDTFFGSILEVSNIYSIFIEILLCNLYITKQNTIYRYALNNNEDASIVKKLNIKNVHTLISDTLSFIFTPNNKNIVKYYNSKQKPNKNLSIFEKLWHNKY